MKAASASLIVVVGCLLSVFVALAQGNALGRGFGDEIQWHSWSDGLAAAKESGRPIMLLLHKTWCGACKNLKPQFAASAEIKRLSAHFVMVNAEDNEAPHDDKKYQIDGGYIPRIFFLNSNGEPEASITNAAGNPQYKYYYPHADPIVASMKTALTKLGGTGKEL